MRAVSHPSSSCEQGKTQGGEAPWLQPHKQHSDLKIDLYAHFIWVVCETWAAPSWVYMFKSNIFEQFWAKDRVIEWLQYFFSALWNVDIRTM